MGLGISLQDENGVQLSFIADAQNYLGKVLPEHGNYSYPMLSSIDFYGDTVFNRMQMDRFLIEWRQISSKIYSPEERELFCKIEMLARQCKDEPHLYLKFIGD